MTYQSIEHENLTEAKLLEVISEISLKDKDPIIGYKVSFGSMRIFEHLAVGPSHLHHTFILPQYRGIALFPDKNLPDWVIVPVRRSELQETSFS